MRPRSTLILVAVAAVAVAGVLLWEKDLPGTDRRREQGRLLVPGVEAEMIETIELQRPDQPALSLQKTGGRWQLTAPIEDRADRAKVERLLADLLEAKVESRIEAGDVIGGDEATGLGPQATRLSLSGPGRRLAIEVAAKQAPGGMRYVRLSESSRLALVRDTVAGALDVSPAELRDRELLDIGTIDIRRVAVVRDGENVLRLERDGERGTAGEWWLRQPIADLADAGRVTSLLSELLALRADAFHDESPTTDVGLEPPRLRISVQYEADGPSGAADPDNDERALQTAVLEIGAEVGPGPRRYATISDRTALIELFPADLLAELDRPADEWRSRIALELSTWDVGRLVIERDQVTLTIERVDDEPEAETTWRVVEPDDFLLDDAALDRTLSELSRVETLAFADRVAAADAGLEPPRARLVVSSRGDANDPGVALEIGDDLGEGRTYARRSGRPAVLIVDSRRAESIDPRRLERPDP